MALQNKNCWLISPIISSSLSLIIPSPSNPNLLDLIYIEPTINNNYNISIYTSTYI